MAPEKEHEEPQSGDLRCTRRSSTAGAEKHSNMIMMDASVLHWKNLANFTTLNQSVHVCDHGSRSAETPGRGD